MFSTVVKHSSETPDSTTEITRPLLLQTVAASMSGQLENKNSTSPGRLFSRVKASLYSALGSIAGNTQLDQAVQEGDLAKLRSLLGKHADPGRRNSKDQTPLDLAVEKGDVEIIKVLLANPNVKPDVADRKGRTPLSYAAGKGRFDIIALLLAKGADPNLPDENGLTPLAYAVTNGHRNVVEAILQSQEVEINKADRKGNTPLHHAVKKNDSEIVELLLQDDRIDPNVPNSKDLTPLVLAVQDHTPLNWVGQAKNGSALHSLLKSPKVEINKADRLGNTALHHAVKKDDTDIIKLLLKQHGSINPNLRNSEGLTPIALAAQKNSSFALRTLMDNESVDVNLPNLAGETPFFMAAKAYATVPSDEPSDYRGLNILLGRDPRILPMLGDLKFRNTRVDYLRPRNDGVTPLQYLINTVRNASGRSDSLAREDKIAANYLGSMIVNEHIRKDISRDIFDQALNVLKEKMDDASYGYIRQRVSGPFGV